MSVFSLREAAEQAGVSKSTVFRAIQNGRLSAPRDDDGNFRIDAAELFRVYPPKSENQSDQRVALGRSSNVSAGQDAPAQGTDHELVVRLATAEAQLAGMKAMVEELKEQRTHWQAQAERLTLALAAPKPIEVPAVIPMPAPEAAVVEPVQAAPVQHRGWWPFRRAG